MPALALGLAFGRIGNFINGELIGRPTDFFISCNYGDGVGRWPSQLIDSAKNLIIFLTLFWLYPKKSKNAGYISALFLIMIGGFRFLTEFIRQPDPQLGFIFFSLSMGQILSLITFLSGIMLLFFVKKNSQHS